LFSNVITNLLTLNIYKKGYNSWYDVLMSPSEATVRETVDAMVSLGLRDKGYKYVNLDDGIVEVQRDANGDLVPDQKGFPNGFKALADYVHSQGMLFGVYTDRGTLTCGGRAAASGHEFQDAAFYARNDIDYVKQDSCNAPQDHPTAFHEYGLMRDGLNATGRNIFFSLW
jgi:alpha-galactosidase